MKYWPKEEQEKRLSLVYEKWSQRGSVWSAAAPKVHSNCWILIKVIKLQHQVHADQMGHVKKGCLAQHHQDIASDGSWIEGSHKGWNSLQRAQPSGIEMYSALAHDFVLCRNIQVFLSHKKTRKQPSSTDLLVSLFSESHHISLLGHLAMCFNSLLNKEPQNVRATLSPLPALFQDVNMDKVFGLV